MNLKPLCVGVMAMFVGACDDENNVADSGVTPTEDLSGVAVPDAGVPDGAVATSAVAVTQTNLVSNQSGAANTDPTLINAWGLAFGPTGTAWVSSNGNGTANLYAATGVPNSALPRVTIPAPAGATGASAPTGIVFNGTPSVFNGDVFIFATEDGTIAGWKPADGATAVIEVDDSAGADHPVYKGLTMATANGTTRLYVADFHNARIAIFDGTFTPVTIDGSFVDANLPAGYAPFNVQNISGTIVVSYALQDAAKHDDVAGEGHGFIDTFDVNGGSQHRLISNGVLNSPWGMALAPANFGNASSLLLIGNFGDGHINAFSLGTGAAVAMVTDANGNAIVIDGLWSLVFGNGTTGEATNQLFFTAGPNAEANGLFGRLDLVQ